MTSIAIPPISHNILLPTPNLSSSSSSSSPLKLPHLYPSSPPPISHSLFTSQHYHSNTLSRVCRCQNSSSSSSSSSSDWNWGASLIGLVEAIKSALQRLNSQLKRFHNDSNSPTVTESNFSPNTSPDELDWDWDRWRQHFNDVDEQERLIAVLKSQLGYAVRKEHFEDAARLKVAIAAAASNDTVGTVMSKLNRAIDEERYQDAAFMRDNAGVGLLGWWSGISENTNDPQGLIVRITAEHGRYVARSYTPRQLATAATGAPLFEIFLTVNKKGEYRQQAVYLKRGGMFQDSSSFSKVSESTSSLDPLDSSEDKGDLLAAVGEDTEGEGDDDRDDESDSVEAFSGFQNILKDMIPGVKVKVLKVTAPGKVDRDLISKVIEQIIEEDDEEKDDEIDNLEVEDEIKSESDVESDQERDAIDFNDRHGIIENEGQNEIKVKVVIGGVMQKISNNLPTRDMLRTPAKLEKRGRLSFSFMVDNDVNQQEYNDRTRASFDRQTKIRGQRSIEHLMLDLTRFIGRDKIPQKVLKDIGELINLTLNQAQNHQPLSRLTKFNRIELASSSDPLNGLYIGAHGLYTSEIIQLKRKFGQWKEDSGTNVLSNLEFYEYVEATKITGDPYVPAGQVAFRAKVGKGYQLPHKGIIPEEFGVIARYKGQGRLAAPGFRNPRWVDGELVILDGKYIKGGPVVGFVYWAPEYHFLVFFNRLRLQE